MLLRYEQLLQMLQEIDCSESRHAQCLSEGTVPETKPMFLVISIALTSLKIDHQAMLPV